MSILARGHCLCGSCGKALLTSWMVKQFSMEEAGGGGKGERERTVVEWWDGVRMQNECLIN